MKVKILSCMVLLAASQACFAGQQEQPDACPTIMALQQAGIKETIHTQGDSVWTGLIRKNLLGTNATWNVIVWPVNAGDQSEALAKLNAAIPTLLPMTPAPVFQNNEWECLYMNDDINNPEPSVEEPIMGFAQTPAEEIPDDILLRRAHEMQARMIG